MTCDCLKRLDFDSGFAGWSVLTQMIERNNMESIPNGNGETRCPFDGTGSKLASKCLNASSTAFCLNQPCFKISVWLVESHRWSEAISLFEEGSLLLFLRPVRCQRNDHSGGADTATHFVDWILPCFFGRFEALHLISSKFVVVMFGTERFLPTLSLQRVLYGFVWTTKLAEQGVRPRIGMLFLWFFEEGSDLLGKLGSSLDNRLCVVSEETKNRGSAFLGVFLLNLSTFCEAHFYAFSCTINTISKECGRIGDWRWLFREAWT
jgi:hypothetical protein